jgi:glycosyltransferase involved in cell wall biosynthesis
VTPTVSVVVPTYNRRDNLEAVVRPLLGDPATTEVVVVVDGSRDGSLELLQEMARMEPRVKPVFIENAGSARAQQVGVEAASGEVVLVVADDVVAARGLVTGHARHHETRRDVVVVGYMPTPVPKPGARDRLATELYARAYESSCARYEADPGQILRALWAGNVSVRREHCLRVPLDVPEFSARYHEDRDWGLRCLKAGLVGVFDRSLLAEHRHHRPLAALLRDAHNEGKGRVQIHELHADVLGQLDRAGFEANLPRPARLLLRVSRRPALHGLLLALLTFVGTVAAIWRLQTVELRVLQLLRRMEIQAGALEALSEKAVAPPGAFAAGGARLP